MMTRRSRTPTDRIYSAPIGDPHEQFWCCRRCRRCCMVCIYGKPRRTLPQ